MMMKHSLTFVSVPVGVLFLLGIAIPQGNARILQHEGKIAESNNLLRGKRSAKIIDGYEVAPHSLPYQVYLNITTSYNSSPCGGSLISQKYVLTAAHCLDEAIRVQVVLGAHNVEKNEDTQVKLTVTRSIVHAGWDINAGWDNDIGLIELPSEVKLTAPIGIIQLPTRQEAKKSFSGANAKASGWGLTTEGLSPVLLAADLTVIDNLVCNAYYGITTDSQVCAVDNNGKSICSGDSGGPLVELSTNKQIGVVSYTELGCPGGIPSGYTRVGEYLDWIEENSDVKIF